MTTTVYVSNASQLLSAVANRAADTVIVLNPGNYGSVSINANGSALPINLQAASTTSASTFQYLTINNANGVTLTGLTFTPPSTGGTFAGESLEINNSTNVLIQNNSFIGGPTAFTDSASGFSVNGSSGITVNDNTFTGLTRGGIFRDSSTITVTNNTLTNLRTDGFDFGTVNNVEIAYNQFSDFHPTVDDHADGIQFMTVGATSPTTNVNIHDNTMSFSASAASSSQGIFFGNEANLTYQNITIQDNTIYTGYANGISIANAAGVQISGNVVVATDTSSSYMVGIHVINTTNATVTSNITNLLDIDTVSSGTVSSNTENMLAWTSNTNVTNSGNTTTGGMYTSTTVPNQSGPAAPVISSFSTDSGSVGDHITNDNTLTLTGTAEANATVKIYDGATLLGSATANGSGAWSYTTTALSNATHSLTATATDGSGNTSAASTALSVTIDTTAPTAPAISSFSTDSGTVGDGITNDNTLTLTGTAEANATVKVYDGATLLGSTTANGSGAWSYTTAALSNATHSLTATATDVAGNTGAASTALSVTIDTAAPTAPVISSFSTDSGTVGDNITNDNTLTLTGTAEANATVKIYDGATLLGSTTANGSGAWSYTTAALSNAMHSLTATATDTAGNVSIASTALNVTVDTLSPSKPLINARKAHKAAGAFADTSTGGASAVDVIDGNTTLTVTGTAEANSVVSVYDRGSLVGSTIADGTGAWTYTSSGALSIGAHNFTATATDAAGNTSVASDTLNITVQTVRTGTSGDDSFTASSGYERIDGGGGHNTITFNFKLVDATVSYVGNTVVVDSANSHTVLTGFDTYVFTDGTVTQNDGDPLVDDLFYYSQYHDVWNAHIDADSHYHSSGWREGRDPNAFFSTSTYLSLNQDVKKAGIDPLVQFDQRGWMEGRAPSFAFDTAAYLANNTDVAAARVDPLKQFLMNGAAEGRQPVAVSQMVAANGFDYAYYLAHNPDIAAARIDPFLHFETVGWKEGRNPNAYFDVSGYLAHNPDVAASGMNPLDHYHQRGWLEGRDPSVDFDTSDYLAHHPEVAAMHTDPLAYFLKVGLQQGQSPFGDGSWG